jgi:hypothetical protein
MQVHNPGYNYYILRGLFDYGAYILFNDIVKW